MKHLLKHRIILFAFGAILFGLFLVPSSTYANLIVQTLLRQMKQSEVSIIVRKPDLAFIGLYGESVVIRPRQWPIGISLDEVRVIPVFSNLLTGRITLRVTGRWLNGDVLVDWNLTRREISASLHKIQLSQFPPIQGFGIESGVFTGKISSLHMRADGTPEKIGDLSVEITNIEKPRATRIPPRLLRLPMPITIPVLQDTSLKITGEGDRQRLIFREIHFESNLGKLSGKGDYQLRPTKKIHGALRGIVSEAGYDEVGTILKLFSKGRIHRPHQPFQVKISGPLKPMPSILISPIESSPGEK